MSKPPPCIHSMTGLGEVPPSEGEYTCRYKQSSSPPTVSRGVRSDANPACGHWLGCLVTSLAVVQLLGDTGAGFGGVGDQHDNPAFGAVGLQRGDGLWIGGNAVVDTAPEVNKQCFVVVGNLGERSDDFGHGYVLRVKGCARYGRGLCGVPAIPSLSAL